jgi:hypothetical protein
VASAAPPWEHAKFRLTPTDRKTVSHLYDTYRQAGGTKTPTEWWNEALTGAKAPGQHEVAALVRAKKQPGLPNNGRTAVARTMVRFRQEVAAIIANAEQQGILKFMRREDAVALSLVAQSQGMYILLRPTNPESVKYIGNPAYTPKRIDCKPKTADFDAVIGGRRYQTAGLVTDPTLVGEAAYKPGKFQSASKYWNSFQSQVETRPFNADGSARMDRLAGGKRYMVDNRPDSQHRGVLMYTGTGRVRDAKPVYGDFDLYGVANARNPSSLIFRKEILLGQPHFRDINVAQVQGALNKLMQIPLVMHGSQDPFMAEHGEPVIVVRPDGTLQYLPDGTAVEQLYRTELQGRPTGSQGAVPFDPSTLPPGKRPHRRRWTDWFHHP